MKLTHYSNAQTLFFVSGMFAGHWIWEETHSKIPNTNHLLLEDPLCALGGRIRLLTEKIVDSVKDVQSPVTLIGNSLGSLVSLNVARELPDKIEKVIISGSAGFGEVNLNVKLSRSNARSAAQDLVNMICYDKQKASEEAKTKTADSFEQNLRNIIGLMRDSNITRAKDVFPHVKCPVHAIWGANDVITPIDSAREVFEQFDVPISLIEECGHSPMYEKPEEFAQLVKRCL